MADLRSAQIGSATLRPLNMTDHSHGNSPNDYIAYRSGATKDALASRLRLE
jgi:hypothetical protein